MWFLLAILAGLFYTGNALGNRYILRNQNDSWAFSFFFSAVGALISLPFMLANPQMPSSIQPWLIMLLIGGLIVINNLFFFSAFKYLPASVHGLITKLRLIWVMLLGIIILQESSSLLKILGVLLIFFSGIIIIRNLSKAKDIKGILYASLSTFLYAVVIILYKFLFTSFSPQSLTFFIFLIPALLNLLIMPNSLKRIYAFSKTGFWKIFLVCAFGSFANLLLNQSLSIGEAGKALAIYEGFLVITLVGEKFILKEHQNIFTKILAVILATAGAVLIRLS